MDGDVSFNIVRSLKRPKEAKKHKEKNNSKRIKSQKSDPPKPSKKENDVSLVQLLKEIPQRIPFQGKPTKTTFSVALPVSLVQNIQTDELRAYIIGSIARTLTIYGIHEVILYNDIGEGGYEWQEYFAVNLRFLETPQYLRRYMFPLSDELRNTGLQNPLDAPHHLRSNEWLPYREGVIKLEPKGGTSKSGSLAVYAECGLFGRIEINNPKALKELYGTDLFCLDDGEEEVYQRVTVRLDASSLSECKRRWMEQKRGIYNAHETTLSGSLVAPDEPQCMAGLYWGYVVREVDGYNAVFEGCPFNQNGTYDFKIGTSERGDIYPKDVKVPKFNHLLMVLGPVHGLESIVENPQENVDAYVNFCYNQRSRTIRTEEALTICLSQFFAHYSI